MKKTLFCLSICVMLIILTFLPGVGSELVYHPNSCLLKSMSEDKMGLAYQDDELDQCQDKSEGEDFGITLGNYEQNGERYNEILAQSFTPSLNMLTRVFLDIKNYSAVYYPVTVSIRKSLDGPDLTSIEVSSENIVRRWTEFDFNDIAVNPGEKYYIVATAQDDHSTNPYSWAYGDNNPYNNGESWWRLTHPEPTDWTEIYILDQPDLCFQTYGYQEKPPEKPARPTGNESGTIDESYTYYTSTTEPDGEDIYYLFDWGDRTTSDWIGPYNSGEEVSAVHSWGRRGTFEIKVKAKDVHGAESEWSDPLVVSMPKGYAQQKSVLPNKIQFFLKILFNKQSFS